MPRIGYFGPSGTFTEMALDRLAAEGVFSRGDALDGPIDKIAEKSPVAALDAVRARTVDAAVVPIESSVEGAVVPTLDALAIGPRLQIVAETELDVSFSILARESRSLADVRTVRAYPVAAAQVREWLDVHCPDARFETASSNAGAAEDVAAGLADAAVSTALAGERLGLVPLAEGVADVAGARTRFVVVTTPAAPPARTGSDRTSVVLEPDNVPGSLVAVLSEFAARGIDLTRIESRPTRTEFGRYRFFVDCIGHIDDDLVAEALRALHRRAEVRFLGSWPTADPVGPPPADDDAARAWLEHVRKGDERS
ncbi:prephenate dehydratase [Rhodococcus sp. HNM0569]|uniref:prephenate dehydratase n=1 Tax=Rhodococcus sp. HNM0569 TaxID=2716340 RepID=UPI00146B2A22|nr:prephenate dehydratase [Rhodococcus sp. HNM0569]